jgi:hypothetical protein
VPAVDGATMHLALLRLGLIRAQKVTFIVYYLLVTRRFDRALLDFLPIGLEHLVKGAGIRGARKAGI